MAVLVLPAGLLLDTASPVSAASSTTVVGVGSGRCLDVAGGSAAVGAGVELWDCDGRVGEQWDPTSAGELRVFSDSMCLDVYQKQTAPGTKVDIWSCNGGANQQWRVNADGTIVGVQSGLCLDATAKGTADGTLMELWTCNGGSNQKWTLTNTSGVPTATGDARAVSEPKLPSTICATLSAGLTMSNRTSGSTQEASPPDTSRIQSALNSCSQSGSSPVAVKLVGDGTHTAFLSAPLTIPAGVALELDSGVALYASLNASDYQVSGASAACGTVSSSSGGCRPFITVSGANAGIEAVRASGGSQGRIDARGDLDLNGTSTSWFDLAATAKSEGLNQNNPRLIQAVRSDNFTLYDIDLLNAANFHVVYEDATGFTAWGVRIKTPATAGNTDGIDPSGAVNVTIADSYIMDGDDGVAVKAGSVASRNITVKNNHFYGTHGISIGSETAAGMTNMLVENNTIDGVDANGAVGGSPIGLRIKSNSATGGRVEEVSYLGNCVTRVKQPLVFDTHYGSSTGSNNPYFTDILVNGLRSTNSMSSGTSVISGYSSSYPIGLTLVNVELDKTATTAQYAKVGLYNSNLIPSGTGVTTSTVSGSGSVPSCAFPSFPAL